MQFYTTIQDMTGVYKEQPFMKELEHTASTQKTAEENPPVFWIDCKSISGTDCYCDDDAQAEINSKMDNVLSCVKKISGGTSNDKHIPGIHFFDNGNYHYMSKLWTDRIQEPFDLIVFDHHPDMQPPRFEGILSCGGWVKEVLDNNPFVRNVMLIGVADHLIEEIKNEPSAEFEKYANRVTFIPESSLIDAQEQNHFSSLLETFSAALPLSVYISIDKDALSINEAITNWDQGSLTWNQLKSFLQKAFEVRNVLGIDICGERAREQDYANGMDEGTADQVNNQLNINLYKTIVSCFKSKF